MSSLIFTFNMKILKALMLLLVFVNQQNNSNQQFIYINLTVVSTTELTLSIKQNIFLDSTNNIFFNAHPFIRF